MNAAVLLMALAALNAEGLHWQVRYGHTPGRLVVLATLLVTACGFVRFAVELAR